MNTRNIADGDWPNHLVKRIERLERQNRFLRLVSILSLILPSAILLMAQSSQNNNKAIAAGRFELVDSAGRTRAALGMTAIGPALLLIDEKGATRFSLNTTATGSSLKLYDASGEREGEAFEVDGSTRGFRVHDKSGKIRAGLLVSDKGPALLLADADGKPRISLDLEEGSQPGLSLLGSTGKPGLELGIDDRNNSSALLYDSSSVLRAQLTAGDPLYTGKVRPGLYLRDPSGRVRVFLFVPETGEPQLLLHDSAGNPRTSLSVFDSGSMFALVDPAGHIRASLALPDTGNAYFALKDTDGKVLFSKP